MTETLWHTRTYCATCERGVSNAATECRHCGALFGRNVWGTLRADVGEGYCPDCEREEPWHYDCCPHYPRSA